MRAAIFAACALASIVSVAQAQQQVPREPLAEAVLATMHRMHELAIQAAALAVQRATDDDVRDYAERLWRDHRFADRQVLALAEELDMVLAPPPAAERRARRIAPAAMLERRVARLAVLEGAAFDAAFVDLMGAMHRVAVRTLRGARAHVEVEEVRELLSRLVPILEQHAALAAALAAGEPEPASDPATIDPATEEATRD